LARRLFGQPPTNSFMTFMSLNSFPMNRLERGGDHAP
jgi:hypothetical protein